MYVDEWQLRSEKDTPILSPLQKILSRFGYVYLMKHKFEAFDKFKEYQGMVEK